MRVEIQRRIPNAPHVFTPRQDVGTQLAQALADLAKAPKGGAFSCKWHQHEHAVLWGYVWREANGCRSAISGGVYTHDRHVPLETVEVDEPDRYGILDCYARFEDLENMAWATRNYGEL